MHLDPVHLKKADENLRSALVQARENDPLCVILLLEVKLTMSPAKPDPREFSSRTEWRKSIVQQQQALLQSAIGSTLDQLRGIGLEPQGGALGQVVVQGPASDIVRALEIAGIQLAVLDWAIPLP